MVKNITLKSLKYMIFLGKANIATQIPHPPLEKISVMSVIVEHSDVTHRQFDWCLAVPWHYHQDTNCFKKKTLKFDAYSWEIYFLFWEETCTNLQSKIDAKLSQQRFCRCHVTKHVRWDDSNNTLRLLTGFVHSWQIGELFMAINSKSYPLVYNHVKVVENKSVSLCR